MDSDTVFLWVRMLLTGVDAKVKVQPLPCITMRRRKW